LLLISDLETDAVFCRDLLDELGIRVSIARSEPVAGAIREISGTQWDIIVVSATTEALLENDLLPSLKTSNPDGPVVVLCEDFDEERFVRILRAGATNVVSRKNRERIKRILEGALSDSIDPGSRMNEERLIHQREDLPWLLFDASSDPLALLRVDGDGDIALLSQTVP
jgi:DNA-binding NarL/FixJ family response regulator